MERVLEDEKRKKDHERHAKSKIMTKESIYRKYEGKCVICGENVPRNAMKISLIVPRNEGGNYNRDNMELCCEDCYREKRRKRAQEFASQRPKKDKSEYVYNANRQLCWKCKKACGGYDCEWANRLKPVEGWTAVPTMKAPSNRHGQIMHSYAITECPKFEREERKAPPRHCDTCKWCRITNDGANVCTQAKSLHYKQNVKSDNVCDCWKKIPD